MVTFVKWLVRHQADVLVTTGLLLMGVTIGRLWPDLLWAYAGLILVGVGYERAQQIARETRRSS